MHIAWKVWVNLCRFVLAVVFIFSGFVKAVDPLGTQYKIQDYLEAFGMGQLFPVFLPLAASVLLAALEFCIGVYFLFGIRRNTATILTLILMGIMTPLTLYLAIANPVSDCGCFGDALLLTNWETFWKNVFLSVAAVSVFIGRGMIFRLVSEKSQWLVALYTLIYIIAVSVYCLYYLPLFDFRPYRIGANIPQGMEIPEGAERSEYESVFVLEKDGVKKEFTLENYPDSTWTFVDAKSILKKQGYEPPVRDFSIVRADDGEDITAQVLGDEGYTFLLVAHRIEQADDSTIDLINEIYDYSVENGYAFYCLTSSPQEEIVQWQDKTGAEYPFCQADDITLKTMIRSNPGLMLLKEGVVVNKWSRNNLPDEYTLTGRLETLGIGVLHPENLPRTIGGVVLWFALPLLFFLGVDVLYIRRRERKKKKAAEASRKGAASVENIENQPNK